MLSPDETIHPAPLPPLAPPYGSRLFDFARACPYEAEYYGAMLNGLQPGQVFSDGQPEPSALLFWHYSGYASVAGKPDEAFAAAVRDMVLGTHLRFRENTLCKSRFILQQGDACMDAALIGVPGILHKERLCFRLNDVPVKSPALPAGFSLRPLDGQLLSRMHGDVTPGFSWPSDAAFLRHGKGFCVAHGDEPVAWAFSAAIGLRRMDIGVETVAAYRGRGLSKAAAAALAAYACSAGLTPVWGCDSKNLPSRKTAESVGFVLAGRHAKYVREPGSAQSRRDS